MATIKSYTDIEQSRKLAEILPLESADMVLEYQKDRFIGETDYLNYPQFGHVIDKRDIACWSLAALLSIASTYCNRLEITLRADKNYNIFAISGDFVFRSFDECSEGYNNPIDACYRLILKLYELKML